MAQTEDQNLFFTIRQVLWLRWDPIGIRGLLFAPGEYDSYIPEIIRLLKQGEQSAEIADYLSTARTAFMKLPTERGRDELVADLLKEAYAEYRLALSVQSDTPKAGLSREELKLETARYSFGALTVDQMQAIINRLTNAGIYYDTFYDVLYPDDQVPERVGPAFELALKSLEIPIPAREASAWGMALYYLAKIASCEVDPYEGLKRLVYEVYWRYDLHQIPQTYADYTDPMDQLMTLFMTYDHIQEWPDRVLIGGKSGRAAVDELKKEIKAAADRWAAEASECGF